MADGGSSMVYARTVAAKKKVRDVTPRDPSDPMWPLRTPTQKDIEWKAGELATKLADTLNRTTNNAFRNAADAIVAVMNALAIGDEKFLREAAKRRPGETRSRGAPPEKANRLAARFVQIVQAHRDIGKSDSIVAVMLVHFWTQSLGGRGARKTELLGDDSKLAALADPDPKKFVINVHRALGYPRSDNLFNRETKAIGRQTRKRLGRT